MTPQDFLNVSYDSTLATPTADAGPAFATIQWSHQPGGWLLPVDRAEEFDVTLPWPKRTVRLGTNEVPCYYSASAEVAILAIVKRWFVVEDDKPRYLDTYVEGARSKSHALVIFKDAPDNLFVLSCKGATSADLHGALGKLGSAMKRANATRPWYFFWLKLSAGDPIRLSKGATVAPLLLEQPGKADNVVDWLAQRFVGAEFVAEVEARYAEDMREFVKPRERVDAEASNGLAHQQPAPLPATGPAPAAASTTTTATAPWSDGFSDLPSAAANRDVAMGLARGWKSNDDAINWALSLGAFANLEEAQADYWWLYGDAKAKHGAAPPKDQWASTWIDAVLAMVDTSEEVGF